MDLKRLKCCGAERKTIAPLSKLKNVFNKNRYYGKCYSTKLKVSKNKIF